MLDDSTPEYPLCACGCGRSVVRRDGRKQRFLRGHSGSGTKVDAVCATCAIPFRTERWRVDSFNRVYCSKSCCDSRPLVRETRPCSVCGAPLTRKPSIFRLAKNPVCASCVGALRHKSRVGPSVSVACESCGKEYLVWPSKAKINKHHYCSIECRALHIVGPANPSYTSGKGRKVEYGFNWKRQRRLALIRDKRRCQHCGKVPKDSRSLHVHHIRAAHLFAGDFESANALTNLITLCLPCHKAAEFGRVHVQTRLI